MEKNREQREGGSAWGFLSLRSLRSLRLTSFSVLVLLLFFGALFWARKQDPFSRKWFTVKTADHGSFKCVAVLPKPMRQYPVIIYAHGSGGTLMNDGNDLRQMAELGLAVVSLEYNQTNEAAFAVQFEPLLHYLGWQQWVNTNAIAWVGYSLGANRMLDFALQHPDRQPRLLVQLSGAGVQPSTLNPQPPTNLHCPVLFVHSEQDEIFPIADTKLMASVLQTNGVPVEMKVIPGVPHGMEPERGVVFRSIGECCLTHLLESSSHREKPLTDKAESRKRKSEMSLVTSAATEQEAWQKYHSIALWQAEAPPLWLFWLPAVVWIDGWFWWKFGWRGNALPREPLKRSEIALRWLAALLATWVLAETALHLVPPHLPGSDRTHMLARRFSVRPKERIRPAQPTRRVACARAEWPG